MSVTTSSAVSNFFAIASISNSENRGTSSLGLMMALLPAAMRRDRGRQRQLQRIIPGRDDADHAERLRDQPVLGRRELYRGRDPLGAIQHLRCLAACLISPSTSMVSAIAVSTVERWPKSAEIAASNRASFSVSAARSRTQPVQPRLQGRRRLAPRQLELALKGLFERMQPRAFQMAGPWRFPSDDVSLTDFVGRQAPLLRAVWQDLVPAGKFVRKT